jgi:hypothetical protein
MSADISQKASPRHRTVWSARYVTPTLVVLLLALVPTIANSYIGRRIAETPPLAEVLPASLDGRPSSPTRRKATSIAREFATDDWVERAYETGAEQPITVLAVRSYDMKRLYHHPELAVTDREYQTARLVQVDGPGGPLDVHVLPGMAQNLAAYALIYRGQTVAHPYLFQVRVAPELLLIGQRPLTLVFAEDPAGAGATTVEQSAAVRALVAAVSALSVGRGN